VPAIETNTRKIVQRLEKEGWIVLGDGRHDKFEHPARTETIVVPRHREVSLGVARSIAKLAGWS